MQNFWHHLEKPFFAIAPMANVTDAAFRHMFARFGKPDVLWTEFVSVEALLSAGRERALIDLRYEPDEHPIVAQIFGAKPDQFEAAAAIVRDLGFDGIDVNMGCPDRSVERQGAGAALIKDPVRAKEIIRATQRGSGGLPVSVKTRIGYTRDEIASWIPAILEENVAALTVHFRTRDEMSDVPARWDLAPKIAALRDRHAPATRILGNGDIASLAEAVEKASAAGIDGVMIGRGVFGDPWFFSETRPTVPERLDGMAEHAALFEKMYRSDRGTSRLKNFDVMKKHFGAYASGFSGARELRMRLMETSNATEVAEVVAAFKNAGPHAANGMIAGDPGTYIPRGHESAETVTGTALAGSGKDPLANAAGSVPS